MWPAGRPGGCWRGTQPQEGLLTNGSQVLLIQPTDDLLQHSLVGRRLLCAAGIALCLGLLCSTERRSGLPCMCNSSESSCTSDELSATTCHAADVGAVGLLHQLLTGTHAPWTAWQADDAGAERVHAGWVAPQALMLGCSAHAGPCSDHSRQLQLCITLVTCMWEPRETGSQASWRLCCQGPSPGKSALQVLRAPVPAKPLKMQANLPVTPDCLGHPPAAFPVIFRMISAPCCGSCRACISTFLHSSGCHMLGAGCLPALGVMRLCPPTDCAAQGLRAPCPPVADGWKDLIAAV